MATCAVVAVLIASDEAFTARERAWLIGAAGGAPPAREVVLVDLERWPIQPSRLEQLLVAVAAARPSVVVLDVLADSDASLAGWVRDGTFGSEVVEGGPPVLLVASCEWAVNGGSPRPLTLRRPVGALARLHCASAELAEPERLDLARPLTAARQVWHGKDDAWLGAGLAAALVHRGVELPAAGLPPAIGSDGVEVPRSGRLLLDDGALWLDHVPSEEEFVVLPASDVIAGGSERTLAGRVVVVGLVRDRSSTDWHLTPGGWRRGAVLHAALAEQALAGRSYVPLPAWVGWLSTTLALLLGGLVASRLEPLAAGGVVLLFSLAVVALGVLGIRMSLTLAPVLHATLGATAGLCGVGLGRALQLRRDLNSLSSLPTTPSEDPVATRLRRVYFLCAVVNERVKVGVGPCSDEQAATEQRRAGYVFQHSDRVLRRFAAMDWERGTWRGVRDVVELLYQGIYEASGALKRVPAELKQPDGSVFVLKQLRNYFAHSYDIDARVRARLDGWLAEAGVAVDVLGADAGQAGASGYLRVQLAVLDDAVLFLEALDSHICRSQRPM